MSKLYTTESAAEYLSVTPARVRQLIMEKRLESQKYGRDHLIQQSALEKYLATGKKKLRRKPNK